MAIYALKDNNQPVCLYSFFAVQGKPSRKHARLWDNLVADLSNGGGDCEMSTLSDKASVTMPLGQKVSKEEVRDER
ncbi:unnamed protein product [Choristocarpus tenellus]